MRCVLLIVLLFSLFDAATAQRARIGYFQAGVGTENNIGFRSFTGGAGMEQELGDKWTTGVHLLYFNSALFAFGKENFFSTREQFHRSLFLTPKIGYRIIGHRAGYISITLMAGPALQVFKYKMPGSYTLSQVNGRWVVNRSTLSFEEDKGSVFSFYSGFSFNFNVAPRLSTKLLVETYSREIPVEFFLPSFQVGYRF